MKKLLLALAVLTPCVASAADVSVIVGGFSKHYKDQGYNETHPAIGLEYNGFSAVYVQSNSIEKPSVQLAYGRSVYETKHFDVGWRVGVATGYTKGTKYANGEWVYEGVDFIDHVMPIVAAELTYHTPVKGLDIVADVTPVVTMLGFKYKL